MIAIMSTGRAVTSRISHILARGFSGSVMSPTEINNNFQNIEKIFIYGFLRGGSNLIKKCIEEKKEFYYVDHAYIGRTKGYSDIDDAYFRISKNCMQPIDYKTGINRDRLNKFDIKFDSWKKGNTILFLPPTKNVTTHFYEPTEWENSELKLANDANININIRAKKDKGVPVEWGNYSQMVTYNSTMLIESLMNGLPIRTSKDCIGYNVSGEIDKPYYFDREDFLSWVCYQQFTGLEYANGTAKKILEDQGVF